MNELEFKTNKHYRWIEGCLTCKYFKNFAGHLFPICTHPEASGNNGEGYHSCDEKCTCDGWIKKEL